MEKLEKRYVKHTSHELDDDVLDDKVKKDIQVMVNDGWTIQNVVSTQHPGEARAVVVTFSRKKG